MRPSHEIERVLRLATGGMADRAISELTGIPRTTVRDWRRTRSPAERNRPCAPDPLKLPPEEYAYLLGIYLGDGCLTAYPRGVWKLRIFCDAKYTEIVDAVRHAIVSVRGAGIASVHRKGKGCVEVAMYWKHWPRLLPQHGAGPKWKRRIELVDWQEEIAA